MVALPEPLAGQPFASEPELTEYVVVLRGLTVKTIGLAFVLVPPPLFNVTTYGPAPPLTVTVTVAELPGQFVAAPDAVAVMAGQARARVAVAVALSTVASAE
jgi:hypothetical protein